MALQLSDIKVVGRRNNVKSKFQPSVNELKSTWSKLENGMQSFRHFGRKKEKHLKSSLSMVLRSPLQLCISASKWRVLLVREEDNKRSLCFPGFACKLSAFLVNRIKINVHFITVFVLVFELHVIVVV